MGTMLCTCRLYIDLPFHLLRTASGPLDNAPIVVTGAHRNQQGSLHIRDNVHEEGGEPYLR